MLDAATVNVEGMRVLAVTQVDIDIVDCALDIRQAHLDGRITTEMRSQLFTEARRSTTPTIAGRHIGFGTANWAVLNRAPNRFCFPQPGPPEPGWAGCRRCGMRTPAVDVLTARSRSPGCLSRSVEERLHHGPMLVVTEAVALESAAEELGTDELVVEHLAMTVVAPGRVGPFIATPVFTAIEGDSVGCRVELRDAGRGDRLIAATFIRMRMY